MLDHVIQEYKIFVDNVVVGMTTDNSFIVEELSPDTFYVVMVTSCNQGKEGNFASIAMTTPPSIERGQFYYCC